MLCPYTGLEYDTCTPACTLFRFERLHVLTDIADEEDAKASDSIRAIDLLGKYGGIDKLRLPPEEQPVAETMTPERIADFWKKIERIRSIEECEKILAAPAEEQAAAKGGFASDADYLPL